MRIKNNIKNSALSLLAMLALFTAVQPVQAQCSTQISPYNASYISGFNLRYQQIGDQINGAMASGQLTPTNGNALLTTLSQLENEQNTCLAGGGFTDAQAQMLATQINTFAQEATNLIATDSANHAACHVSPFQNAAYFHRQWAEHNWRAHHEDRDWR